jgi:hypothetical protein
MGRPRQLRDHTEKSRILKMPEKMHMKSIAQVVKATQQHSQAEGHPYGVVDETPRSDAESAKPRAKSFYKPQHPSPHFISFSYLHRVIRPRQLSPSTPLTRNSNFRYAIAVTPDVG